MVVSCNFRCHISIVNMLICVTGSEGFIGSHLVERLLALGHSVRGLVQYNSFNSVGWLENVRHHPNLQIVLGDVRDSGQMEEFCDEAEIVFHLASLVAIPHSYSAPHSYLETNVFGTLNMLQAARRARVKRFIQTSTSEVYGSAISLPISEKHPLQAQSPYSASKISADAVAYSYWTSFEFPAVILRPFNTFGPRQSMRAVIPTLVAQALTGAGQVKLGALSPRRDFTYIDDTVEGFIRAMGAPGIEGEAINLGTGYDVSVEELVRFVEGIVGRGLVLSRDKLRVRPDMSEVDCLRSDNSKALALLDWQPKLVGEPGLREGLSLTAEWLKGQIERGLIHAADYVT